MKFTSASQLDRVFEIIFHPYKTRVPDVQYITEMMIQAGMIKDESEIVNDHIAFRTLGVPNLGIQSLEKIFLHFGYRKMDYFNFEAKKLDAYWYAPPSPEYPRIFMSELRVKELSKESQAVIHEYTSHIVSDPVDDLDFSNADEVGNFFNRPLWQAPTLGNYYTLAEESEYASWVINNRFYLNHYTISIHELGEKYNTLEAFNEFLESKSVTLNSAGGKIKTSADGLLKQSSTVAQMVDARFSDQTIKIPGSFVEFAERKAIPEFDSVPAAALTRNMRREGFEADNADKIFESTYEAQTRKVKV